MTPKVYLVSGAFALFTAFPIFAQTDTEYESEILRALGELPSDELAVITPSPTEANTIDGIDFDDVGDAGPAPMPMAKPEGLTLPQRAIAPADLTVVTNGGWIYTEGTARAIRREYLTFQASGRVAFVDPNLREGVMVQQGHTIAYQEQTQSAAELAGAAAQVVDSQTQLAVAQATKMEADANLLFAEKTFQRFAVLLQQNSASQQEYDQAAAQLEAAKAASIKSERQIASAQAGIGVATAQQSRAEVVRQDSYLIAPISGLIARFNIEQGYYFSPQLVQTSSEKAALDTIPVVLLDTSRFEISVTMQSEVFDDLQVGSEVLIDVIPLDATLEERLPNESAGPKRTAENYQIAGAIYSISPSFDPETRTFKMKVRTNRGAERIRDGESVSLWIRKARR